MKLHTNFCHSFWWGILRAELLIYHSHRIYWENLLEENDMSFLIWQIVGSEWHKITLLGGLSLHLNHLIAERMSAHYWQFGTLPIGIFLSNLVSGQLDTSLMTSYCHFWNLSTFGNSRAIWVFWPKLGVFRKSKFSRWRSYGASMRLGDFR